MISDSYYKLNASKYTSMNSDSLKVTMDDLYLPFEKYLQNNDDILDIGFGSGRDSLYFAANYNVTSIDVIPAFVEHGINIGLKNVKLERIEEINFENQFNGIWACASLLHLDNQQLNKALEKIIISAKNTCIFYSSFKYGDSEIIVDGRYFNNMNKAKFNMLFNRKEFKIIEIKMTKDKLNRGNQWFNSYISIIK